MKNLRQKLNERLDKLQDLMQSNYHLDNPETVVDLIDSITFAWNVLSEEDKEYIQCCELAIEKRLPWNLS